MKVLVTGHHGYIGSVMISALARAGHQVAGLDTYLYAGCDFGDERAIVPSIRKDVRDITERDLVGFDAVIHLAALSNDPLGGLDASTTLAINHLASVALAAAAKSAGVTRFLFASSCSLYGAARGDTILTEAAEFNPITAYGVSKVRGEADVSRLADERFSPTFLRSATAYGVSPRLRVDVVVNNLTGVAWTTGEVVIQSDGTPWRPLVHVEDISRAFLAVLEAPRELVHNEAFNVGSTDENYQVREIAEIVRDLVPGSKITYHDGGGPDARCYRVNCDKLASTLPDARPEWTVRRGVAELCASFKRYGLTAEDCSRFTRLRHIQELFRDDRLDSALRWKPARMAV